MRASTIFVSASAVLLMAGGALPVHAASEPAAEVNAVKNSSERFAAPLLATHDAAVAALKLNGFDIKSDEAALITGARPRKIGLVVGSGGEKIRVTLAAEGDAATLATVNTTKTFVGMAGQKNWDKPVLDAMTKNLAAATEPAPVADTAPTETAAPGVADGPDAASAPVAPTSPK